VYNTTSLLKEYYTRVDQVLSRIVRTQAKSIARAGGIVADAIVGGHRFLITGCGHSYIMAEEADYRAGGLVVACALLEPSLILHENPSKASALENLEGYGEVIIDHARILRGDVLVVVSNSGQNAVPVEMALEAKRRGAKVIAVTSLEYSQSIEPRHSSGKKLYEVADVVIDNCGVIGDAAVALEGMDTKVGPTSTIAGVFIVNRLVIEIVKDLLSRGIEPPVFKSLRMPDARAWNERHLRRWEDQITYFSR
jgi:uncharacterized phosphosugar-binding protein